MCSTVAVNVDTQTKTTLALTGRTFGPINAEIGRTTLWLAWWPQKDPTWLRGRFNWGARSKWSAVPGDVMLAPAWGLLFRAHPLECFHREAALRSTGILDVCEISPYLRREEKQGISGMRKA